MRDTYTFPQEEVESLRDALREVEIERERLLAQVAFLHRLVGVAALPSPRPQNVHSETAA